MHLKSIRVKNLRNFTDTGHVEIKPITILVGKNSVGKSTFARLFPLIKQSCLEDKTAPILWYGRLVDFGDFKTTKNKYNKQDDSIEFEFILKKNIFENLLPHVSKTIIKTINDPIIAFQIKANGSKTYCSKLTIQLGENKIEITINQNKNIQQITINENNHEIEKTDLYNYSNVAQGKILPRLDQSFDVSLYFKKWQEKMEMNTIKYDRNRSKEFTERQELYNKTMKGFFTKNHDDDILRYLDDIVELCDKHISASLSNLSYSEPLRATAQRFYRRQELAIDEIDSKGINIAMFVDHLSAQEKVSLNKLLKTNFKFSIKAKKDGSHIALVLKEDKALENNLADLGVGYSQLLPLMIQLWAITNKSKKNSTNKETTPLYVIEQPELHLHPEYQSKIADVITSLHNASDLNKINLLIETHSPHLIYRLCELVEEKKLASTDIQILIFEEEKVGDCQIKVATIDENGNLDNWPIGFFQS